MFGDCCGSDVRHIADIMAAQLSASRCADNGGVNSLSPDDVARSPFQCNMKRRHFSAHAKYGGGEARKMAGVAALSSSSLRASPGARHCYSITDVSGILANMPQISLPMATKLVNISLIIAISRVGDAAIFFAV